MHMQVAAMTAKNREDCNHVFASCFSNEPLGKMRQIILAAHTARDLDQVRSYDWHCPRAYSFRDNSFKWKESDRCQDELTKSPNNLFEDGSVKMKIRRTRIKERDHIVNQAHPINEDICKWWNVARAHGSDGCWCQGADTEKFCLLR